MSVLHLRESFRTGTASHVVDLRMRHFGTVFNPPVQKGMRITTGVCATRCGDAMRDLVGVICVPIRSNSRSLHAVC